MTTQKWYCKWIDRYGDSQQMNATKDGNKPGYKCLYVRKYRDSDGKSCAWNQQNGEPYANFMASLSMQR